MNVQPLPTNHHDLSCTVFVYWSDIINQRVEIAEHQTTAENDKQTKNVWNIDTRFRSVPECGGIIHIKYSSELHF